MAQTIQPRSWASLNNPGEDLTINKPEAEDNMSLLLSVLDSLNTLCERLSKLNYVVQRRNMEQICAQKLNKEE